MELFSLKELPREIKIQLLQELGYTSDGIFVLDGQGNRVIDRYIDEPVKVDNMVILPGSTVIIDNNPLSIAGYLEDYGDVI